MPGRRGALHLGGLAEADVTVAIPAGTSARFEASIDQSLDLVERSGRQRHLLRGVGTGSTRRSARGGPRKTLTGTRAVQLPSDWAIDHRPTATPRACRSLRLS